MLAIYNGFNPAPSPVSTATPKPTTSFTTTKSTTTLVPTTLSTVKVTTSSTSTRSTATTTSAAATPTWTPLGCYTDLTSNRGLPISATVSGGLTPAKCQAACSTKGYSLAAVEYGIECWCGNAIGGSSTKAKEAECNMACAGDASQTCGAGNRLDVYAKGALSSATNVSPMSLGDIPRRGARGCVIDTKGRTNECVIDSSISASRPAGAGRARIRWPSTRTLA